MGCDRARADRIAILGLLFVPNSLRPALLVLMSVMRIHIAAVSCCLIALLPAAIQAQLTPQETKALADALFIDNLTLKDLKFTRRYVAEQYPVEFLHRCMDDPVKATEDLMDIHRRGLSAMPSEAIRIARAEVLGDPTEVRKPLPPLKAGNVPEQVPAPVRDIVERYAKAVDLANSYVHLGLKGLSPSEKRLLVDSLPAYGLQQPEARFPFSKTEPKSASEILPILDKVDLPLIRRAAEVLATQIERDLPELRTKAKTLDWKGRVTFRYGDINVAVNGIGDDVHNEIGVQLVIDLGGRNTFLGREGAGVLGSAVVVDCGSGSEFRQKDLAAGTGLLGIGLAYETGSACTFRSKSVAFGSGIAGVGSLCCLGANADFSSKDLSQGFGQFGIGCLINGAGVANYQADTFSQGAARTAGVGWLVSQGGGHYNLRSRGQGFSGGDEGESPRSGGLGLLTLGGGSNTIYGVDRCQGAAMAYGLGSICGDSGTLDLNAQREAQGWASVQACAFCLTLGQSNARVLSEGQGQGFASGHSVAVLLDRSTGGIYASKSTNSVQGSGSLMIAIRANHAPSAAMSNTAQPPQDSLAVLVNCQGTDRVIAQTTEPEAGVVASTVFLNTPLQDHAVAGREAVAVVRNPQPLPSARELERLWHKTTTDTVSDWAAYGMSGFNWILSQKLGRATEAEQELIAALAKSLGPQAIDALAFAVTSKDDATAEQALKICADNGISQAAPVVRGVMNRPALQREAARAAGVLGVKEAVPELMVLAARTDPATSFEAVRALSELADPQSLSTGQALLNSPELPIRSAAIRLVGRVQGGADVGKQLMNDPDERVARTGIQILAEAGTPEALDLITQELSDMHSGVRIQALLALKGRIPESTRPKIADMKEHDPSALVRAVATGLN